LAGEPCHNTDMAFVRALAPGDLDALVTINNQGYPAVPLATPEEIQALLDISALALGAVGGDGHLVGFLIGLNPGEDYDSENYRFFEARFDNHLYIDRVVLAEGARGLGLGSVLYEKVFEKAAHDGRAQVTCEVNLEPPNPGSLRFHYRWGFQDIDTQPTKGGEVVVQLLQAPVAS